MPVLGAIMLTLLVLWILGKSGALLKFILMVFAVAATLALLAPLLLSLGAVIIVLLLFLAIATAFESKRTDK